MSVPNQVNDVQVRKYEGSDSRSQKEHGLFGSDGLNFADVIDLINPLHHIPVVGRIYRSITNDQIAPAIRIAGATLFGGPIGAAFAAAGIAMDKTSDFFSKKSDYGNMANVNRTKIDPYSFDEVIAERRMPIRNYRRVIDSTSDLNEKLRIVQANLQNKTRQSQDVDWSHSMNRRSLPLLKISELIGTNYRQTEDDYSNVYSERSRRERLDTKL